MVTILPDPVEGIPPDPDDWPAPRPDELSEEALQNEPEEVAAVLHESPTPMEADEADLLDQRRDVEFDQEDDQG